MDAPDGGKPQQAQPATKLEEQATAKADLSYSYWAAGSAKGGGSTVDPAIAPKKLTEEEARALREQQEQQQRAASSGATSTSAWNSAGTFEERDATEWAKEALTRALGAVSGPRGARVASVDSVAGHASIWFIRGKRRAGFEFDVAITWAHGEGDGAVRGTLKLAGASPDDLDDLEPSEIAVLDRSPARAAAEAEAVAAAKAMAAPLRDALAAFYGELKQR
ncbi:hypothetical protein Rsub_10326 [Raphidocelis subcapitata]|uniref:Activator of Hsp90 ATPase AHSA1-like N-terminal domain-containing protein n=1 Tax=Raphidocelis subcapitata TaxID=307507 RepID=A0A2V0PC73_9CHLO|nr:hypothetical protein Rsub_10326 [Raphidocelis subcapitata]|eukprot:GBF97139.1 hypothetical protein Rsub_10326 [Raphidocelis subcapitata]